MAQNILDIGFDPQKFNTGKDQIVAGLKEVISSAQDLQAVTPQLKAVFDSLVSINSTKINPGSAGGYGELKAQVSALEKEINNLTAANQKLAAAQAATVK